MHKIIRNSIIIFFTLLICITGFYLIYTNIYIKQYKKSTFNNPLDTSKERPDPYIYKNSDGYYYGLHTVMDNGEYIPKIIMYKSKKISDIFTKGTSKTVWTAPLSGWNSKDIWAPELHKINGVWYIYYSGGGKSGVLKNTSTNPMDGKWIDAGRLYVKGADDWAIDGTILSNKGKLYFIWSGITPDMPGVQRLFISKMSSPTELTGPRVEISRPTFDWEKQGANGVYDVNEGPTILNHNGKTFLVYSASFCATRYYCLGMLILSKGGEPMNASSWTKVSKPIFKASSKNGLYGVGHCTFTKSPDGKEDWIVYHACTIDSTTSYEPRYACIQKVNWNKDGTPNLGQPEGRYKALQSPSGER